MMSSCLQAWQLIAWLSVVAAPGQEIFTPNLKGGDTPANQIFRLEDGAMEQWRQGNPLRWAEINADDVIYVDPGLAAPVVGFEAYTMYLEAIAGKVKYDGSEYVKPWAALYGDAAVLTCNYHSLGRDKNGTLQRGSFWNTTQVYQSRAGLWKIVHNHWSYIGHRRPPEVQVAVPVRAPEAGPEGGGF